MDFDQYYMSKIRRQNEQIMTIDTKKQTTDSCCLRCNRCCMRKGGVLIRDWITILLFVLMILSLFMLLVSLGIKSKILSEI